MIIQLEIDDCVFEIEYQAEKPEHLPKFFIWNLRAFEIRYGTTRYEACGVAVVVPEDQPKLISGEKTW
jgi:hypothetical protein